MNDADTMFKAACDDNASSADETTASDHTVSPLLDKKPLLIEDKVKRKAKRAARFGAADSVGAVAAVGKAKGASYRRIKNCRRPRQRYGRGLPKKGGGGGKGTWGKPGSELAVQDAAVSDDVRDPNYDSESQDSIEFEAIVPELNDEELEKNLEPIILEYFEHGETKEVIISINELNVSGKRPLIVVFLVSLALGRKPSQREMSSSVLSDMFGPVLTELDIRHGFLSLLEKLADLVLDTPDAAIAVGNFIARAVADDCLPPKFVEEFKDKLECPYARTCLEHANNLLRMKHGLVRLDNVWGVGGGMRPVKYLVKRIQLLLKEYIYSGDINEAIRCLQELEVPHFHHEFVYEAVIVVIEDMKNKTMDHICQLLQSMCDSGVVSIDQLKNGFERVYNEMPDICIDVPHSYKVLKSFVLQCGRYGFLSDELIRKMPTRGRKRFYSEGDGGLIKD